MVREGLGGAVSKLRGMANTRKRAPARSAEANRPLAGGVQPARARARTRTRSGARRRRIRGRARDRVAYAGGGCRGCRSSISASATCSGLALMAVGIFMGFVL